MPFICYETRRFQKKSRAIIHYANEIINDYAAQGFKLTVRQIYYQFVARDLVENHQKMYNLIQMTLSKARMAGEIDWGAIEDRTRYLRELPNWENPASIIQSCVHSYHINLWEGQEHKVEVWIEKDALVGVIEGICEDYDVPHFACRGYNSQSEQWKAGQRLKEYYDDGYAPVILHLGDHDPSGIHMTEDNQGRLAMFSDFTATVKRIALNIDQVNKYKPPPNFAKDTDTRYEAYRLKFGDSCWELDALEPSVIVDILRKNIESHLDLDVFNARLKQRELERSELQNLVDNYADIKLKFGL